MLKSLVQHIQDTAQPRIITLDDHTFAISSKGCVTELLPDLYRPDTLPLTSLDALVKLVQTEAAPLDEMLYITIPTPLKVLCFAQPDWGARCFRQVYYEAEATDVPGFTDGFRPHERAIIELRSKFAPGEGVDYLLDLLSRISKDSNVATNDNGVSQTVEARRGVSLREVVGVRPRVALRPFRTFQEVEQPESEFLLRLSDDADVGLFEADGGMWKLTARQTIKSYLEDRLSDLVTSGKVVVAL